HESSTLSLHDALPIYGMQPGEFGTAETLSKAKNTVVGALVRARVLKSKDNRVQLLGPGELEPEWKSEPEGPPAVWSVTQQLIDRDRKSTRLNSSHQII